MEVGELMLLAGLEGFLESGFAVLGAPLGEIELGTSVADVGL